MTGATAEPTACVITSRRTPKLSCQEYSKIKAESIVSIQLSRQLDSLQGLVGVSIRSHTFIFKTQRMKHPDEKKFQVNYQFFSVPYERKNIFHGLKQKDTKQHEYKEEFSRPS